MSQNADRVVSILLLAKERNKTKDAGPAAAAVDDYGTDADGGPTPAPAPAATPTTAEPAAVTPSVSPAEPTAVDPVAEPIGAEPTVGPEVVAPLVDEPTGGPEPAALEPESTVAPGTEEGDIVPLEPGTEADEPADGGTDDSDSETVSGEVPPGASLFHSDTVP